MFKNFDTLSFFEIVTNKKNLIERGYDEFFLNESKHKMLSLPFFLFFMTALASIFTMNTLKKDDNFRLILIGLIVCVITFYLKDLSLALGQTERIPIILAIWSPIIALSFFSLLVFCKLMKNKILAILLFFCSTAAIKAENLIIESKNLNR